MTLNTLTTQDRIRRAALDNGWTIKATVGDRYDYARGGIYDHDIFVIGSVDRYLVDGTPVTEPEHTISVWYRRGGAVSFATGNQATVEKWIYHDGILGSRSEANKSDRILAALAARTSDIPKAS